MDKTTKHVRDIAAMWNSKALKSASLRALALAWTLPRKVVCVCGGRAAQQEMASSPRPRATRHDARRAIPGICFKDAGRRE